MGDGPTREEYAEHLGAEHAIAGRALHDCLGRDRFGSEDCYRAYMRGYSKVATREGSGMMPLSSGRTFPVPSSEALTDRTTGDLD